MVVESFAGSVIQNKYLCPVAAAARNSVGGIFAVMRHVGAGQSDSAVVREFIWIEKYLSFTVGRIGAIKHILILKAVVFIGVIFIVIKLCRHADFRVIV